VSETASIDASEIDVSGAITLVVARRTGPASLKGYRIAMHTDVATELREICARTLVELGQREPVPYSDDLAFDAENQYLLIPTATLVAHRPRPGRRSGASGAEPRQIEVDARARRVLADASSLPAIDATEVQKHAFVFYAAVVGDDPDQRVAFLDKWNPYKAALSGQLMTFFGDRLRRIDGPLLVFERSFDMVVTDAAIAVLDAKAFEGVFREIDAMTERFPTWTDAAINSLPLDDESATRLRAVGNKGGRITKQLRGLYERGTFTRTFRPAALRREMLRQDLDASRLIVDGKLVLTEADIPVVLKLVDEKLYKGWATETSWETATRSRR
jgi:hypothetical protein